jgi:hypothetical protein
VHIARDIARQAAKLLAYPLGTALAFSAAFLGIDASWQQT